MKKTKTLSLALTGFLFISSAEAQTVNMTADVTVQNALTLAAAAQLDFGTVAAAGDAVAQAEFAVATDGTYTSTPSGTGQIVVVDDTSVAAAQVDISDGADGATINITINNVVDPTDGTDTFELNNFVTSYNGGADTAQVIGTPFTETFDITFGGGTNTLGIGASLLTTVGAGAYGDAPYAGTYDVVFSY